MLDLDCAAALLSSTFLAGCRRCLLLRRQSCVGCRLFCDRDALGPDQDANDVARDGTLAILQNRCFGGLIRCRALLQLLQVPVHVVLDLLLQAAGLLDLVDLCLLEELKVLEHERAQNLAHSLVFVRARLIFVECLCIFGPFVS